MGWAHRSKQQRRAAGEQTTCGNPEPFKPTATIIRADRFTEAVARGARLTAKFSDRTYAVDTNGTIRRMRPPQQPVVRYTQSTIESPEGV